MASKILTRLVGQLEAKSMPPGKARAVALSTLQRAGDLKTGTATDTPKGAARGKMGAAGRAKDRASKGTGHKPSDFGYSIQTNRATLKGNK